MSIQAKDLKTSTFQDRWKNGSTPGLFSELVTLGITWKDVEVNDSVFCDFDHLVEDKQVGVRALVDIRNSQARQDQRLEHDYGCCIMDGGEIRQARHL